MKLAQVTDALSLKYLALKQCILSSIACFTTLLALMLMVTLKIAPVVIGIDLNVSIICIILMYKWNKYIIYFCCPHCKEPVSDVTKNLELTTISIEVVGQLRVSSKTSQTEQQSNESVQEQRD
eukprot:UN13271